MKYSNGDSWRRSRRYWVLEGGRLLGTVYLLRAEEKREGMLPKRIKRKGARE